MTRSRYYLLRLGQAFGIKFFQRHGTAAATESHLLREAEEILGALCWRELENVEELSTEYWQLRKLGKEHESLLKEIEDAQETLTTSHSKRAAYLEEVVGSTRELVDERDEALEDHDRLASERQLVLGEARSIKRRHDGLKAKLEVLSEEGKEDQEGVAEAKEELATLKKRFRFLRTRRDEIGEEIGKLDEVIARLDKEIEGRRDKVKAESSGDFEAIGKANRDISSTRNRLLALEDKINGIHSEIGKHLAANPNDPVLAKVARPHRRLITQIRLLRDSVRMNRILSNRHTGTTG